MRQSRSISAAQVAGRQLQSLDTLGCARRLVRHRPVGEAHAAHRPGCHGGCSESALTTTSTRNVSATPGPMSPRRTSRPFGNRRPTSPAVLPLTGEGQRDPGRLFRPSLERRPARRRTAGHPRRPEVRDPSLVRPRTSPARRPRVATAPALRLRRSHWQEVASREVRRRLDPRTAVGEPQGRRLGSAAWIRNVSWTSRRDEG